MDIKTMRKVGDLRDKADKLIGEHLPPENPERNSQDSEERFEELGNRVLRADDTSSRVLVDGRPDRRGRRYTRTIPLPHDMVVRLEAETCEDDDDYSPTGGGSFLTTVRATWHRAEEPAGTAPLHTESVNRFVPAIPEHRTQYIASLALLEETFDYADASIQASQLTALAS
ncbi:MAG: hypothetical protein ACHQT9_00055 [Candidatus Saccharimonadales bacterium]